MSGVRDIGIAASSHDLGLPETVGFQTCSREQRTLDGHSDFWLVYSGPRAVSQEGSHGTGA